MSVIFSRQCEYAIQALIYLAGKSRVDLTSIKEIAEHIKVPYHFVGKILQKLASEGLLKSQKGLYGGFALARPADKLTLLEIIEAIDGDAYRKECVIGFPNCSDSNPCPIHDKWAGLREDIIDMLKNKTLKRLSVEIEKPGYK